jgi:transposase-like protein
MVEETFEPGMTVSLVARRHGVAPNQLFTCADWWRKAAWLPPAVAKYNRWSQRGLWQRLFEQIAASGDVPRELGLATVRMWRRTARQPAQKGGSGRKRSGRSRGGRTSKIHCLADDRGRPVAFALTPGNVADISMAVPLLSAVTSPKHLIADKAYDADRGGPTSWDSRLRWIRWCRGRSIMRTRRRFSAEFKAKVALEAIQGHLTVAELGLHPVRLTAS